MKEDEESERLWRAGRSIGPTRGIAGGSGDFCISLSSFLSSSISSSSSNASSSPLVWNRVHLRNTRNMAKYKQHRLVECRNCWNRLAKSASRVWDFFPILAELLVLLEPPLLNGQATAHEASLQHSECPPTVLRSHGSKSLQMPSAILPFLEWDVHYIHSWIKWLTKQNMSLRMLQLSNTDLAHQEFIASLCKC